MKILVDHARCVGHARCEDLAPEVYTTDASEGRVVLLTDTPDASLQGAALRGAKACPERCLTIIDDKGETVWPPSR